MKALFDSKEVEQGSGEEKTYSRLYHRYCSVDVLKATLQTEPERRFVTAV